MSEYQKNDELGASLSNLSDIMKALRVAGVKNPLVSNVVKGTQLGNNLDAAQKAVEQYGKALEDAEKDGKITPQERLRLEELEAQRAVRVLKVSEILPPVSGIKDLLEAGQEFQKIIDQYDKKHPGKTDATKIYEQQLNQKEASITPHPKGKTTFTR